VAQEFIFPDPAVRVNAAASSDSDATPIGAGTPATRSPTNSLGARLKQQDAGVFVEPKPVLGSVSARGPSGVLSVTPYVLLDPVNDVIGQGNDPSSVALGNHFHMCESPPSAHMSSVMICRVFL